MCIGMLALLGQLFLGRALQIEKTATVTAAKYSQLVFAFVWQVVFLR
jgi:hypothetical protein